MCGMLLDLQTGFDHFNIFEYFSFLFPLKRHNHNSVITIKIHINKNVWIYENSAKELHPKRSYFTLISLNLARKKRPLRALFQLNLDFTKPFGLFYSQVNRQKI